MMTAQIFTTNDLAAKWAETFERLRAAEAASQDYIAATNPLIELGNAFLLRQGVMDFAASPDFEARLQAVIEANPAYFMTKSMETEMRNLARAVNAIESELIAMQAPDAVALQWKFETAARDGFEWDPEHLDQLCADMARLLGLAPDASVREKAAG